VLLNQFGGIKLYHLSCHPNYLQLPAKSNSTKSKVMMKSRMELNTNRSKLFAFLRGLSFYYR